MLYYILYNRTTMFLHFVNSGTESILWQSLGKIKKYGLKTPGLVTILPRRTTWSFYIPRRYLN